MIENVLDLHKWKRIKAFMKKYPSLDEEYPANELVQDFLSIEDLCFKGATIARIARINYHSTKVTLRYFAKVFRSLSPNDYRSAFEKVLECYGVGNNGRKKIDIDLNDSAYGYDEVKT